MVKCVDLIQRLEDNVSRALVGKTGPVRLAVVGLLARGHLLIEDVPGVGKTTLARTLAWEPTKSEFVFKPGPLFTNIILADEINRTTPKTQSSLLEAMNEAQVSLDHSTYPLPRPFMVLATQNPREYEGTFPLPESQLDRFLLRIRIGYPDTADEKEVLRGTVAPTPARLQPVLTVEEVLELQDATERVRLGPAALNPSTLHPVELAGQAAALDLATSGRAYLGLAPSDSTDQTYRFGYGPSQTTPTTSGALVARI